MKLIYEFAYPPEPMERVLKSIKTIQIYRYEPQYAHPDWLWQTSVIMNGELLAQWTVDDDGNAVS